MIISRSSIAYRSLITGLVLFMIASALFSITLGQASISFRQVIDVLLSRSMPHFFQPSVAINYQEIIWNIRIPRILLGILTGASLSTTGMVLQTLTRNPLADPHLLGISSGASVGAVAVIMTGIFATGFFSVSLAAFIAGLIAFLLVFRIAATGGRITPLKVILAGVAVSAICASVTSFLVIKARDAEAIQTVQFWLMGSLAGAQWSFLPVISVVVVASAIYLCLQARVLNVMLTGEESAITLGVDVQQCRRRLIFVSALNIGCIVAVTGSIGFIGMVIPHITRLLIGSNHIKTLPASALIGSIFIIWTDLLARIIAKPEELPIGIITALIGAPFFISLMRKSKETI